MARYKQIDVSQVMLLPMAKPLKVTKGTKGTTESKVQHPGVSVSSWAAQAGAGWAVPNPVNRTKQGIQGLGQEVSYGS